MTKRWLALTMLLPMMATAAITQQPITYQLSYQQYQMPAGVKPLGVLGLHGYVNFTRNWYAGMGVYGGVKGQSGGYFALSLDGGYTHPIVGPLWLDAGASVGAGGGRSTDVGGGLYVHPRVGLSWHWQQMHLGVNYSWIKFTDGQVNSTQLGMTVSFPTTIAIAPFTQFGQHLTMNQQLLNTLQPSYIAMLGQIYWPHQGTRTVHGQPGNQRTDFVGAEFAHFLSTNSFWFVNATGAFHGRGNGYANALLGLGWQYSLSENQRWLINTKLGVGSGGGGDVDTGGGLVIEPMLGLEYRLNQHYAVALSGSYLTAPEGDFNNWIATAAIKYYFANNLHLHAATTLQGWRIRLANETYLKPRARTGATNPSMQLMNVNFDYWLNRSWYLSGQTAFAYKGQHTGGYFSGLLGPGVQWPLTHRLALFAEGLFGTAGGAGLDIGSGAMWQADVGCNYRITPAIAAQASIGRLSAFKGEFASTIINVGMAYRFASV